MAGSKGKIYDIFFDPSMSLGPFRLLTGRFPVPVAKEMILLQLYPNIGDIGPNFWEERYKLISWYGLLCERPSSQTEDHFYNQREYCESVASAREGTDVLRIWRGTSSKDICSMAFLMDLVRGKDLTVIDMELDSRFRFTDLVSAPQEVIYGAFGGAGLLDEGKRRKYEDLWKELSAQNAPIRTLGAEGNVIGADDGYFDYEILLKIPPGGALFSETVHDLIEDRRLDDMGRLFWTRRLRSLVSNGVLEASDTDADKSRFPFECMLTKR